MLGRYTTRPGLFSQQVQYTIAPVRLSRVLMQTCQARHVSPLRNQATKVAFVIGGAGLPAGASAWLQKWRHCGTLH